MLPYLTSYVLAIRKGEGKKTGNVKALYPGTISPFYYALRHVISDVIHTTTTSITPWLSNSTAEYLQLSGYGCRDAGIRHENYLQH